MNELDEIRAEVTALRGDVDRLQEDAPETRAIAVMADRDVSEVRSAIRGIVAVQNALRETQLEQGQTLRILAETTGALLVGQQRHEEILSSLVTTVGSLESTVGSLVTTVGSLESTAGSLVTSVSRHDELFAEILDRLPPKPRR